MLFLLPAKLNQLWKSVRSITHKATMRALELDIQKDTIQVTTMAMKKVISAVSQLLRIFVAVMKAVMTTINRLSQWRSCCPSFLKKLKVNVVWLKSTGFIFVNSI